MRLRNLQLELDGEHPSPRVLNELGIPRRLGLTSPLHNLSYKKYFQGTEVHLGLEAAMIQSILVSGSICLKEYDSSWRRVYDGNKLCL